MALVVSAVGEEAAGVSAGLALGQHVLGDLSTHALVEHVVHLEAEKKGNDLGTHVETLVKIDEDGN